MTWNVPKSLVTEFPDHIVQANRTLSGVVFDDDTFAADRLYEAGIDVAVDVLAFTLRMALR